MSLKSNLFPPKTPQQSYMQSLLALILATLAFYTLGALTKDNPDMSMGTSALVGIVGLVVLVAYIYAVIKHIQAVIRVFKLPQSTGKTAWMILSAVGGVLFMTLMLYFFWMVLFVIGFLLNQFFG